MFKFEVRTPGFMHPPRFQTEIQDQFIEYDKNFPYIYNLPQIEDDRGAENVEVQIIGLNDTIGRFEPETNQIFWFNISEARNETVTVILTDQD